MTTVVIFELVLVQAPIAHNIGATGPENADVEALKLEVTELRQKNEQLQEENGELKQKVNAYSTKLSADQM